MKPPNTTACRATPSLPAAWISCSPRMRSPERSPAAQNERAAMVVYAVDARILRLTTSHPREHVQLMSLSLQSGSQFGNVNTDAADTNGMERFPREHCNPHGLHLYPFIGFFRGFRLRPMETKQSGMRLGARALPEPLRQPHLSAYTRHEESQNGGSRGRVFGNAANNRGDCM